MDSHSYGIMVLKEILKKDYIDYANKYNIHYGNEFEMFLECNIHRQNYLLKSSPDRWIDTQLDIDDITKFNILWTVPYGNKLNDTSLQKKPILVTRSDFKDNIIRVGETNNFGGVIFHNMEPDIKLINVYRPTKIDVPTRSLTTATAVNGKNDELPRNTIVEKQKQKNDFTTQCGYCNIL